ncbi:unnamed protein product, partial [Polarella glacialis]
VLGAEMPCRRLGRFSILALLLSGVAADAPEASVLLRGAASPTSEGLDIREPGLSSARESSRQLEDSL